MREMKDSGIEWIGNVPEQWKIFKVQDGFYRKDKKAKEEEPVVLSLARSGVKIRNMDNAEGQFAASYYNYNPVEIDDLLINPMDLISGDNCSISEVNGVISPAYINLRYKKGFYPKYYHYYFKYQYWCKAFFAHGKGVSYENRWTLNNLTLMKYPLIVPTPKEQQLIANFLDEKCGEIDVLTKDIQEQIETLQEYKKSVITEVVTKGLDPNVEMKYSGIEWIGEVPKHWECKKVKYACEVRNEKYTIAHGALDYFALENLVSWEMKYISTENEYDINGSNLCYKGDVVFGKLRPYLAKTFLVDYDRCCSSEFAVFHNFQGMASYYLYVFTTSGFVKIVDDSTAGVKMPRANIEFIKNVYIPVAPFNEQQQIADYLCSKCSEIDAIIQTKKEQLETLAEYKKSLIYEYVTGKKEVQNV